MMKEFPINELLTAAEMEILSPSVTHIFAHLKRTAKLSPYPLPRYLKLIEAISRDVCNKVLSLLQVPLILVTSS